MRYYCHHGTVAKMLLVCSLLVAFSSLCHGADYTVHVVEPAVTNHVILPDGPLPPVCKEATTVELFACRGEYEPASFVVSTSKPLEAVRIEVGQLSGPGGSWPKEAVDVRVVKEYYRGVPGAGAVAFPTLLVHDESFLAIEPDPTPENPNKMKNVLRGELRDTAELQPVSIERRKQFWVTVHVPEHARPGTYKTTVRIVPQNSAASELGLQVEVYPFDLLAPMLEYSIYYPVRLVPEGSEDWLSGKWTGGGTAWITPKQYIAECKNMLAHGLTNPNIYAGVGKRQDGTLDYSHIEEILAVREEAGMGPGLPLYMMSSAAEPVARPLTEEEKSERIPMVREVMAWGKRRGYPDVYWSGHDEAWGDWLASERDSFQAIQDGGGKVFAATIQPGFFDLVGDVFHLPVLWSPIGEHLILAAKKYGPEESLRNMAEIARGGSFKVMSQQESFRKAIDGVHRLGNKIFTYMNPTGGVPLPELQRRNEGLGLWRVGFDGTMTWAYMHIGSNGVVEQPMGYAKVFRTDGGVLDTLHWEGWREGVDDVRYLTTLLDALNRARGRFRGEPLVSETDDWIDKVDVANGDLDAIRREMAGRTIALMDLGYKELPPDEALAEIDLERVLVIAFPEPWRFKMDAEDRGVREKWFDPATDDSQWSPMQVGTGYTRGAGGGWGNEPGFGWYRTELPLTGQDAKRKFKYLYFGACDEDSWVYLNGRQVFEHSYATTGMLAAEIWVTPFVAPLTGVEVRGNDLLAVRVYNSEGMGGIWKPVHLILSDQKLTKQQVEALIELKTAAD